jgi:acetoin utilization protein AcuB
MLIKDIMTSHVKTVSESLSLFAIQDIFAQESFHHLLVEDDGVLLGVISDRDVSVHLSKYLKDNNFDSLKALTAKDIMTSDAIVVDPETPISTASILLLEHSISCLPVVDVDFNISGIVTWKDILRFQLYNT